MLPEFCKHAQEWLDADEKNIVAIHCKAGKVKNKEIKKKKRIFN